MSSMTDVVFLLLIFFMIASTLAKQLNTIDVKLPQAEGKTETVVVLKNHPQLGDANIKLTSYFNWPP